MNRHIDAWTDARRTGGHDISSVAFGSLLFVPCMVFSTVFNSISVISWQPVRLSILSCNSFDQYYVNYSFPKPMATFPHNHCQNIRQRRQRNESCRNDYHQSTDRILAEPGDQTSDLLFSAPFQLLNL